MIATTLKTIRKASPCEGGWEKLLKHLGKTKADDKPLDVLTVLESNGLDDALWVLSNACPGHERLARLYACDVAERALRIWDKHYPSDKRPAEAIETARKYADGQATQEELFAARAAARAASWGAAAADASWAAAAADAAWAAARAAAWAAARDAVWAAGAADAAWAAARDAVWAAEREWQERRLRQYLNGELERAA